MRLRLICLVGLVALPTVARARIFGAKAELSIAQQGPLVAVSNRLRAASAEAARGLDAVVAASTRPKTTSESLLPAAGKRALVSAARQISPTDESLRQHWVVAPYLEDVRTALDQLGHAERFGEVAAPTQRLVTALFPLTRELQDVVALGVRAEPLWIGSKEAAAELALHVTGLVKHVDDLEKVDRKMQRPAEPPGRHLRVTWVEQKSGGAIAHLRWSPRASIPSSFQTEIYRASGSDTTRREATLAATLASNVNAFDDLWEGAQPEMLRYFLVGKTVFGIESEDAGEQAIGVPEFLAPPTLVTATTVQPTPQLRDFYHAAGAVTVSWHRSRSDFSQIRAEDSLVPDDDAPRVERYEISRVGKESFEVVGQVAAGVETFVDVPSPDALREGIRYAVTAIDFSERAAGGPNTASQSDLLRADLGYTLALARTGMEHLSADALTAGGALRILSPKIRAEAQSTWQEQSQPAQTALKQQFWKELSDEERRRAYIVWHPSGGVNELSAGTVEFLDLAAYARRDEAFDGRANSAWEALEPSGQRAVHLRWQESRGRSVERACSPWMHTTQASAEKNICQQDRNRFALLEQLDPEERQPIFQGASESSRTQELTSLNKNLREAMTHTDWPYLRPDSMRRWHQDAWGGLQREVLPKALLDDLMAWHYWQGLGAGKRVALIRQAVGPVDTLLAQGRYFARPLDVWLDFKLGTILLVLLVGTGCALFLRRMRLDGL